MWDWAHFKGEGWLRHLKRSGQLSGLLFLGGLAMMLHMLVPFWQQPSWLSAKGLADTLESSVGSKKE
jgi:uncharacterized membrane protein SirB2|tara:strand:- start:721 stop:921 length:201 start_codon:yes stop_codon:yes gene_type:complete